MVVLVLAASTALYVSRLDLAPVYLGGDEAHFAIGGDALAHTGRNVNGDRWPLFFNLADPLGDPVKMPWGDTWYHPMLFYLIALALKVQPLSEAAVRLPNAIIGGLLTPGLLYLAAKKLGFGRAGGLAALVIAALTPVHFILSREALDYTLAVPFASAWVWLLADYVERPRLSRAIATGLLLGVGCYSYIASWGAMPFLLGVTWLVYWQVGGPWMRAVIASGAGFAPAVLIALTWLQAHPTVLHETSERYRILETNRPPGDQLRVAQFGASIPLYASYFEWDFLFRTGGPNITTSTGMIGVFLKPLAVLVPIGLWTLWRRRREVIGWPLVAGLLFAPLPAAMSGHEYAIQRAVLMVPFAALIGACGFAALWRSRVMAWRAGALVLVCAAPFYVQPFLNDYYGHHRQRSAFYFDNANFKGIAEHLAHTGPIPAVYLRRDLDAAGARWRFYMTTLGRRDLLARTFYVSNAAEADAAPVEARLVMYVESATIAALTASGRWELETVIRDVDGRESAAILRKRS